MEILQIRTIELSSMSVYPDEVKAVQLDPGEVIWCKGERHVWETPVALIVDRPDEAPCGPGTRESAFWVCT